MNKFSDYLVFVDESGDHSLTSIDETYPVFVLACCVIHKNEYANNLTPKIRHLKMETFGHDLVILHEADIRRNKGVFSSMNKLATQDFMSRISSIVKDTEFHLLTCDIDKKEHIKRYGKSARHLYHYSLEFCLTMLHVWLRQQEQTGTTHIICEARGRVEDEQLELEFRRICDGDNGLKINLPFDLIISPKIANSEGLQVADLMARPIGLKLLRPNQANQAYEILESKRFTKSTCELTGQQMDLFGPLEKQKGSPETQ